MTKILRIDVRPDADAILAAEVLRIALIVGTSLLLVALVQRLA